MTVETVTPDELEADESTPGILRKVVFRTDENVLVHSRVESGMETGWHHHGDRHAFGYLMQGTAILEYGAAGRERRELEAPLFFHISPGTVHREIISSDEDALVVVSFVGSGPVAVNVDGPEPA